MSLFENAYIKPKPFYIKLEDRIKKIISQFYSVYISPYIFSFLKKVIRLKRFEWNKAYLQFNKCQP